MPRSLSLSAFFLCLLLAAFAVSGSDAPQSEDLAKQYELKFQTRRVDEIGPSPAALLALGENRIQLTACFIDGGCIAKETVTIGSVEKLPNGTTVVNLTYTVDGQPCKALFTRELKATMRLPGPGTYRIKLWFNELFHNNGPVLSGEKEIKID